MKRCPQCGVLAGDKKAICRNCQTSLINEAPLPFPGPSKQHSIFLPATGIVFCLAVTLLAFAVNAWKMMIVGAGCGYCLSCFTGVRYLWRSPRDEAGKENGLIIFLCATGILLSMLALVYGSYASIFHFR